MDWIRSCSIGSTEPDRDIRSSRVGCGRDRVGLGGSVGGGGSGFRTCHQTAAPRAARIVERCPGSCRVREYDGGELPCVAVMAAEMPPGISSRQAPATVTARASWGPSGAGELIARTRVRMAPGMRSPGRAGGPSSRICRRRGLAAASLKDVLGRSDTTDALSDEHRRAPASKIIYKGAGAPSRSRLQGEGLSCDAMTPSDRLARGLGERVTGQEGCHGS